MVTREGSDPSFAFKMGPLACFCLHSGENSDSEGYTYAATGRAARAKDGGMHSPDSAIFLGETCCADDVIALENDCYSMAAVKGVGPVPAVMLPLGCALVQFFVLYFFAFSKENLFDEGQWLEPISRTSMSVNFMKVVSFMMVLFKISTELQHAQKLCHALVVGVFEEAHSRASGSWALVLQYLMALSVLYSAISVVLAAQSAASCILKIFSVFVVVDMDNLAGRFIISLWPLDFNVPVSPKHAAAHHVHRTKGDTCRRMCFVVLPIMLSIIMAFTAVSTNTVPLSWLKYGRVSNSESPQMLSRGDGCCPPQVTVKTGDSANYSVLLLGSLPKDRRPPDVPRVFWVAIGGNHRAPSPLQIMDGRDGDDNFAFHAGQVDAEHVQAKDWLEMHNFGSKNYYALRDEEQLNLRTLPYSASFAVTGLQLYGITYLVYVAAQNPKTMALTPEPVVSERFVTTVCADGCLDCNETGPGRCDTCGSGLYLTAGGHCESCPQNCLHCQNVTACDIKGCMEGFSVDTHGQCTRCKAPNCKSCYANVSHCRECKEGYGNAENYTCVRCAHPRCNCKTEGGCDWCEPGWGLTINGTCLKCQNGCKDCKSFEDQVCRHGCQEGFGPAGDGSQCRPCQRHCLRCNATSDQCEDCRIGFGYTGQACEPCKVDHCEKCDGAGRCFQCQHGFGVTQNGACDTCGTYCRKCGSTSDCSECKKGYVLQKGKCWTCADRCATCARAGRAKCDLCLPGFTLDNSSTCIREEA